MPQTIDNVVVFGLRCSGTNYVTELIRKNYPGLKVEEGIFNIWKHMWQGEAKITPSIVSKMAQTTSTLFIFVARNVFEWLQSFNQQPHHCRWAVGHSLVQLLETSPFESFDGRNNLLETYPSILDERKCKHRHIVENVLPHLPNSFLLQYEEVRDNPDALRDKLSTFGIERNQELDIVNYYKKETNKTYVRKTYSPINPIAMDLILRNTDWDIEAKWNYQQPLEEVSDDSSIEDEEN